MVAAAAYQSELTTPKSDTALPAAEIPAPISMASMTHASSRATGPASGKPKRTPSGVTISMLWRIFAVMVAVICDLERGPLA